MSTSLPKQKKLVSISQAAKLLGVSIDTVRRWDKTGVLHSIRADGKNRYFELKELEGHKSSKLLSISEASLKLGISATTLRRLEKRGLLVPKRNKAGERVYRKDSLDAFLKSSYFAGKKALKIKEKPNTDEFIIEKPVKAKKTKASSVKNTSTTLFSSQNQFLHGVLRRAPEMFALTIVFVLLIAISLTNITLASTDKSKAQAPQTKSPLTGTTLVDDNPAILTPKELEDLEKTEEPKPDTSTLDYIQSLIEGAKDYEKPAEATTTANLLIKGEGAGPESTGSGIFLSIKTNGAGSVDIREKPSTDSATIGKALDGEIYPIISRDSDWYQINFYAVTGFVPQKFAQIKEIN